MKTEDLYVHELEDSIASLWDFSIELPYYTLDITLLNGWGWHDPNIITTEALIRNGFTQLSFSLWRFKDIYILQQEERFFTIAVQGKLFPAEIYTMQQLATTHRTIMKVFHHKQGKENLKRNDELSSSCEMNIDAAAISASKAVIASPAHYQFEFGSNRLTINNLADDYY